MMTATILLLAVFLFCLTAVHGQTPHPCNAAIAAFIATQIQKTADSYGYSFTTLTCINQTPDNEFDFLTEPSNLVFRVNVMTQSISVLSGNPGSAYGMRDNLTDLVTIPTFNAGGNTVNAVRTAFADTLPSNSTSAGLTIGWTTPQPALTTPSLLLGTSLPLIRQYNGTSTSYFVNSTEFHYVTVYGLNHSTMYYYQIYAPNSTLSQVYNVTTSQQAGNTTEFTIAVIADHGLDQGTLTRNALINNMTDYAFVAHIGDASYADDYYTSFDLTNATYENIWDEYQRWMEPITSHKPYMIGPGNHEASCQEILPTSCPVQQQHFSAYRHRYRMPSNESYAYSQSMWYSMDYGQMHMVFIDSETDYMDSPEGPNSTFKTPDFGSNNTAPLNGTVSNSGNTPNQLAWLEFDLKQVNRSVTPFVIMLSHRPMYSADYKPEGGFVYSQQLIDAFEPLLNKYSVDMFLTGHVHWYERMYPVRNGTVLQTNYDCLNYNSPPIHITQGSSGNVELMSNGTMQSVDAFLDQTDIGYTLLTVHNATSLTYKFVSSNNGTILDEFTLHRARNYGNCSSTQ